MSYSIHEVDRGLGKLVTEVRCGKKMLAQVELDDGFFYRTYHGLQENRVPLANKDHHGILFKKVGANAAGYQDFLTMVEAIETYTGKKSGIDTSPAAYRMNLMGDQYLNASVDGIELKLERNSHKFWQGQLSQWLDKNLSWKGRIPGLLTSAIGTAAIGGPFIQSVGFPGTMLEGMMAMGIFEICAGFHNFKERGWSGPFHSLGWAFSHMYMRERILGPAKVWDEFLHTNDKLQGSNRISRYFLQRKADKYFSYLTSIFPYTQRQKGLSISYRDGILDKVNETFAGIDCCRQSVLAKEDSFPIIDPWEMDIPELDDKPKITNPWDVDAPEIKSLLQGVKG